MSKRKIITDGIIHPDYWAGAKQKILFLMKEPNGKNHPHHESFQELWNQEKTYSFAERVSELAFGLLKGFPEYSEIENDPVKKLHSRRSVAIMNIKKTVGKGSADIAGIKTAINTELKRNKIYQEIRKIDPDFIVSGLRNDELLTMLFPNSEWKTTHWGCRISKFHDIPILDFYHPSARVGSAALYALLKVNIEALKSK